MTSERSPAKPPRASVVDGTRFTLDGSAELEDHLHQTCRQVLAAVRDAVPKQKLEALLLGGGYGRGEGGVLKTGTGDRPYNDLEFYVFLRGNHFLNTRRYQTVLNDVADRLAPRAGVEVEFKVLSLDKLRRRPASMFYYDLVMGHRWLLGEESLLIGCELHKQIGGDALLYGHARAGILLVTAESGINRQLRNARGFLDAVRELPAYTRCNERLRLNIGQRRISFRRSSGPSEDQKSNDVGWRQRRFGRVCHS